MARHKEGESGVLAKDVTPLCCGCVLPAGTPILIWKHPTPNRYYVECTDTRNCHNIKASNVWFVGEPLG